jgi:hypothetical protein
MAVKLLAKVLLSTPIKKVPIHLTTESDIPTTEKRVLKVSNGLNQVNQWGMNLIA